MAWDGPQVKLPGLVSAGDYSAVGNQFKFVTLSAAKTVAVCTALTDIPLGVLYNRPAAGEAAEVVALGIAKVQGGANLTAGAFIGTADDGQAVTYAAADTTACICGVVLEDNTTADGLATVLLYGAGRRLANP